jgi:hypothetical protein
VPEILNSDTDALAAEYVLGTLDAEERNGAQTLLTSDAEFAAKVKLWERRLGELHLMVEPVEPEPDIWQRIKAKIPPVPSAEESKPPQPDLSPVLSQLEDVLAASDAASAGIPEATSSQASASSVADVAVPPSPVVSATAAPPVVPTIPVTPAPPIVPVSVAPPPPLVERVEEVATVRRRLFRWRLFGMLITLVVLSIAALPALWRFAPEQVPPALQPLELLRLLGVPIETPSPPRKPAPPESQFDE